MTSSHDTVTSVILKYLVLERFDISNILTFRPVRKNQELKTSNIRLP